MTSFREGGEERVARLKSSHLCPSRYQYHITPVSGDLLLTASAHMRDVCRLSVCDTIPLKFFIFLSLTFPLKSKSGTGLWDFKLRRHSSQLVFFLSATSFFQSRWEVPIYLDSKVYALLTIQNITQQNCCFKKIS